MVVVLVSFLERVEILISLRKVILRGVFRIEGIGNMYLIVNFIAHVLKAAHVFLSRLLVGQCYLFNFHHIFPTLFGRVLGRKKDGFCELCILYVLVGFYLLMNEKALEAFGVVMSLDGMNVGYGQVFWKKGESV